MRTNAAAHTKQHTITRAAVTSTKKSVDAKTVSDEVSASSRFGVFRMSDRDTASSGCASTTARSALEPPGLSA